MVLPSHQPRALLRRSGRVPALPYPPGRLELVSANAAAEFCPSPASSCNAINPGGLGAEPPELPWMVPARPGWEMNGSGSVSTPEKGQPTVELCTVELHVDSHLSRNQFVSLSFTRTKPFTLTVAFENYARRWGTIGMAFGSVVGALEGCEVRLLGRTTNILDETVKCVAEEETVKKSEKTDREGQIAISRRAKGTARQRTRTEEIREGKRMPTTVVFKEFAQGRRPEWHFKVPPSNQPCLLDGAYALPLQMTFESSPPGGAGVFSSETLQHLRILDKKGRDVSWVKYWLALAKLRKDVFTL